MFTIYTAWMLENFGLVMFVLAVFISLIHKLFYWRKLSVSEIVYRWLSLFSLGITGLYAFIMHAFFPVIAAATIGWSNSPFQYEVAMANLGFGLIGLFSFRSNYSFRLAAVVGNFCWLWGNAAGHIRQMIIHSNFSIGNAGSWLYLDIFVPLLLVLCMLGLQPKNK